MFNITNDPYGISILVGAIGMAYVIYLFKASNKTKGIEAESPNPFLKWPRNEPCPCKSGEKFKACCLDEMPRSVPYSQAKRIQKRLKDSGMIN